MRMRLEDLPERYRRQALEKINHSLARPDANLERDPSPPLEKKEEDEGLTPPVRVSFRHVRKRLADADNLSGKGALDGIVKAGILADDSPKIIPQPPVHTQEIGEEEYTEITIEEIR